MRTILILIVIVLLGCGASSPESEPATDSEELSSRPRPMAPVEEAPIVACPPHPDPFFQMCLQCPPPSNICAQYGCSSTGPLCHEVQKAPGLWCLSGVGTCDGGQTCTPPAGDCLATPPWDGGKVCCTGLDCDDGNPCTEDQCNGHCFHQPLAGSPSCGAGRVCKQGACCLP